MPGFGSSDIVNYPAPVSRPLATLEIHGWTRLPRLQRLHGGRNAPPDVVRLEQRYGDIEHRAVGCCDACFRPDSQKRLVRRVCTCGSFGHAHRELACALVKLGVRHHSIDDTTLHHGRRRNAFGGESPLRGKRSPGSLRDPIDTPKHRDNPNRLLRMPEGGAFRSEYHVRPDRQFEAAAETKTLDSGNHRKWKPFEPVENRHVLVERRPQLANGHVGPVHDIIAEAEVRPIRTEENRPEFSYLDVVDGIGKLCGQRLVDPVLGRVLQGYDGERAFTL